MGAVITERGVCRRFHRMAPAVPAARAFVRRWLPESEPADRLASAAAEALNNAVDHAAGDYLTVTVDLDGATGVVTVTDTGPGFDVPRHPTMPGPTAIGHRGLAMMHVLVDHVDITASPDGTTVTLAQALDRSANHSVAA